MTVKIFFRYREEVWSLFNKTFNTGTIIFLLLCVFGYAAGDAPDAKYVFAVPAVVYLGFVIKTVRIWLRNGKYKREGVKCKGIIVDKVLKKGYNWAEDNLSKRRYTPVYLLVEYTNPNTNETKQFTTPLVNGCPFTYLSSLDVTVYELPDGSAWATDFRRIKSLKDAVKYRVDSRKEKGNEV